MLRVGEFGMAGGLGVVLTEVLQLLNGKVKSGKVEPGVQEHGPVASRKNEAITVKPCWVLGVVLHLCACYLIIADCWNHINRIHFFMGSRYKNELVKSRARNF